MMSILRAWIAAECRGIRERRLAARLLRLNDHYLADIGLRRDQLQPDGIHPLDVPPALPNRSRTIRRAHGRTAIRPSLQGCG